MHLIVNALSIGSMSGQHVVFGFLRPLARWSRGTHNISVIHYENEQLPSDLVGLGVQSIPVSEKHRHWAKRVVWEYRHLGKTIAKHGGDVLLNVSGALAPRCQVPQAVLCQNPWCYTPEAQYGAVQKFKAWLQRKGYRKAFRNADLMIYISNHLRSLYQRGNPGRQERQAAIAYVGIDDDTFEAAKKYASLTREPLTILSVSAMAPWKGAETLVKAVALLHQRNVRAKLKLVGPWPVESYRQEIEQLIAANQLEQHVSILGRVSDDELHRLYATSQVFCLMSCCESFGIPAAEGMAFGTPVVSTNCCAICEICEGAGVFGAASNPEWTSDSLEKLLTDNQYQSELAAVAQYRSKQFLNWENCATPLRELFDLPTNSGLACRDLEPASL